MPLYMGLGLSEGPRTDLGSHGYLREMEKAER